MHIWSRHLTNLKYEEQKAAAVQFKVSALVKGEFTKHAFFLETMGETSTLRGSEETHKERGRLRKLYTEKPKAKICQLLNDSADYRVTVVRPVNKKVCVCVWGGGLCFGPVLSTH